jgi:hypothetical protein
MPRRVSKEHCDPFQENVAFTFAPEYVPITRTYLYPPQPESGAMSLSVAVAVATQQTVTTSARYSALANLAVPNAFTQPPHTRHPRHSDPPPTQQVLSPNTIPGGAVRVAVHSLAGPWYHTPMSMLPISRVPIRRTLSSKVKVARTFF